MLTVVVAGGGFSGVEAAGALATFGAGVYDKPPLIIADVMPQAPAERAGLRRGQVVLTINGHPAERLRRVQAAALLDWQPGALNRLTVRAPDSQPMDFQLSRLLVNRGRLFLAQTAQRGPSARRNGAMRARAC